MTKRTMALAAVRNQRPRKAAAAETKMASAEKNTHSTKKSASNSKTVGKSNSNNKITADVNNHKNKPWYTVFTKADEEYDAYMATEWGFEKRGDQALFEKLCLEGAQSGLSWSTILKERQAYRTTFFDFDINKVAQMKEADMETILSQQSDNPREIVVRHKGKIASVINNAKCVQAMYEESKDKALVKQGRVLDQFLWSFVNDKPILNAQWKNGEGLTQARTQSPESVAMSKALKKRGFKFVGPTTCYAMMQSVGMVLDHPVGSPEWKAAEKRLKERPGGYQLDTDADADAEEVTEM